jgi:hypothetical protein
MVTLTELLFGDVKRKRSVRRKRTPKRRSITKRRRTPKRRSITRRRRTPKRRSATKRRRTPKRRSVTRRRGGMKNNNNNFKEMPVGPVKHKKKVQFTNRPRERIYNKNEKPGEYVSNTGQRRGLLKPGSPNIGLSNINKKIKK